MSSDIAINRHAGGCYSASEFKMIKKVIKTIPSIKAQNYLIQLFCIRDIMHNGHTLIKILFARKIKKIERQASADNEEIASHSGAVNKENSVNENTNNPDVNDQEVKAALGIMEENKLPDVKTLVSDVCIKVSIIALSCFYLYFRRKQTI